MKLSNWEPFKIQWNHWKWNQNKSINTKQVHADTMKWLLRISTFLQLILISKYYSDFKVRIQRIHLLETIFFLMRINMKYDYWITEWELPNWSPLIAFGRSSIAQSLRKNTKKIIFDTPPTTCEEHCWLSKASLFQIRVTTKNREIA